jgi:hypothetical protein
VSGLLCPSAASALPGVAPELDQPRLLRVQLQPELAQPLGHRALEALGIILGTGTRPPNRRHTAPTITSPRACLPPPLLDPQVKRVVQVDVRQQRGLMLPPCTVPSSLCVSLPSSSTPAYSHFLISRTTRASATRCSMNLISQSCSMVSKNLLMSASSIEVHLSCSHTPTADGVQRVVRAFPRPEAVAEPEEVLFVDGVQDFDRRSLDNLVLQRGHAQRALAPVGLVDVHPLHRLGSDTPLGPAGRTSPEGWLFQRLSVPAPSLAVHPGSRIALDREVGRPQAFDRVDVVQQSGELRTTTASCRLSYAIERTSHVVDPARSPGHARCNSISLGSPPSLHRLRRRRSFPRSLVRQLLRYYAAIRLPAPVAHRCTPEGFSMRSAANASRRATEGRAISRFPSKVLARMRGVSDCAGSVPASPLGQGPRQTRCGLRCVSTTSAPRTSHSSRRGAWITQLNTRPARPPVNASPTPLRMCTHDSGPP